jgi:hypothetical protein
MPGWPTPFLWSPLPWQEGKVAAIMAYIDPVKRPLLVAGDSRSDWAMLFHSGGVRLWVDRNAVTSATLLAERRRRVDERGWVIETPVSLGTSSPLP